MNGKDKKGTEGVRNKQREAKKGRVKDKKRIKRKSNSPPPPKEPAKEPWLHLRLRHQIRLQRIRRSDVVVLVRAVADRRQVVVVVVVVIIRAPLVFWDLAKLGAVARDGHHRDSVWGGS